MVRVNGCSPSRRWARPYRQPTTIGCGVKARTCSSTEPSPWLPVYALTEANLATITRICERLDGLPLAIELAASWIRVLSAVDLLAEIEMGTDVLTSDSAPVVGRHRSMRAVLDSSWQWLGQDDRQVLAALGVFAGGFTREAAEMVAERVCLRWPHSSSGP